MERSSMRKAVLSLVLLLASARSAFAAGEASQATDAENPALAPAPAPGLAPAPSLVPVVPGPSAPPRESAAPQVLAGALFSAAGLGLVGHFGRLDASGASGWYSLAALGGWAIATGAVVCAVGPKHHHGGCKLSMVGALVGSLAMVPGILMLRKAEGPCTAQGPNADDQCVNQKTIGGLLGIVFASGGYIAGATGGAVLGWNMSVRF
jgi:hypothetical protein